MAVDIGSAKRWQFSGLGQVEHQHFALKFHVPRLIVLHKDSRGRNIQDRDGFLLEKEADNSDNNKRPNYHISGQ